MACDYKTYAICMFHDQDVRASKHDHSLTACLWGIVLCVLCIKRNRKCQATFEHVLGVPHRFQNTSAIIHGAGQLSTSSNSMQSRCNPEPDIQCALI